MTLITSESFCRSTSIGNGWTPVIALEVRASDNRTVQRVIDWVGGEGVKPAIGWYIGSNGYVNSIGAAQPVDGPLGPKGDPGPQGPGGPPGDTPILLSNWKV